MRDIIIYFYINIRKNPTRLNSIIVIFAKLLWNVTGLFPSPDIYSKLFSSVKYGIILASIFMN